jgi:hypothetical protein
VKIYHFAPYSLHFLHKSQFLALKRKIHLQQKLKSSFGTMKNKKIKILLLKIQIQYMSFYLLSSKNTRPLAISRILRQLFVVTLGNIRVCRVPNKVHSANVCGPCGDEL